MAKRRTETETETALDGFAEDFGRLLGTAQRKAEGWLGQRQNIAKELTGIRDTASRLLQQLTGGGAALADAVRRARRGRPPGKVGRPPRKDGRPVGAKRKRRMSAAGRANISAAQKKRWALQKAGTRKK